jgi:hypothetical protein
VLSGRSVLVTVNFDGWQTVGHAREVARAIVRWLEGLIDGWVKIIEKGRRGVHLHFVVRLAPGVWAGVRRIEARIGRCQRERDHIGGCVAESVKDAGRLAAYLTKSFSEKHRHGRVCRYPITYSQSIARRPWWLGEER